MRVEVSIPYKFTARKKGARKDADQFSQVTLPVEIPIHHGPAHEVGRFGMPGRFAKLDEAGVINHEHSKGEERKGVFSELDGRSRRVFFFDNDFWVETGSTQDIQERIHRRAEENLDPFAVSRGDVNLYFWRHGDYVDPAAERASGRIKTIVASYEEAYKAAAVDRARQDLRVVGDLVLMRTAEPVIAATQHNRHRIDSQRNVYEVLVVPASDKTSTGFQFMEDPGRIASFAAVPLHRRDELVAAVHEHAAEIAEKGGERTVVKETGTWRNRRRRRVQERFDIDVTVVDTVVADVHRHDLLAFDDFTKKASNAAWRFGEVSKEYLRQMSKDVGLAVLRLMDAREASRGIVTPRIVEALREVSELMVEGCALTVPKRVPGARALSLCGYHHAMDEESGKFAELKASAGEFLDALEMRVPGRDWFDLAYDAAADFRGGFAIGEICTLTEARNAAAALGESDVSDLALEAARGECHLIGVVKDKVYRGVLHLTGPADAPEVARVFAKPGQEEMVASVASTFVERVRAEAAVDAVLALDIDVGTLAPFA